MAGRKYIQIGRKLQEEGKLEPRFVIVHFVIPAKIGNSEGGNV